MFEELRARVRVTEDIEELRRALLLMVDMLEDELEDRRPWSLPQDAWRSPDAPGRN